MSTASLHPIPRRWVQRAAGTMDLHARQKWSALWPYLASLPLEGVEFVDAGCGRGQWTIELATLRPAWRGYGIDRDQGGIEHGRSSAERLGITSIRWSVADFFAFEPDRPCDLVLSVASAHYAALDGNADTLFQRFRSWLRTGGTLLMLVPRRSDQVPFVKGLSRLEWHPVFSSAQLIDLCRGARLSVENLSASVGRIGTLAKQFDWTLTDRPGLLRNSLRPFPLLMSLLEPAEFNPRRPSAFWVLRAVAG